MKGFVGIHLSLAVLLASVASASPVENRDVCGQPKYEPILCSLSSSYSDQVAAFCTKYLPAQTVTQATTTVVKVVSQASPAVAHQTKTVTQTSTSTITTTSVTTLPTTVTTSTVTQITTSLAVTTPPTSTVVTTVWTTPAMKRREMLQERNPLPGRDRGREGLADLFGRLATDVAVQVCRCFHVSSPVTTKVHLVTATTVVYTSTTITVTDTATTVVPTQVTQQVVATSYTPVTAFTTAVSVVNIASTALTPTTTSTVTRALAPQCTNVRANGKVFRSSTPGRQVSSDTSRAFITSDDELGFDICCSICYLDIPDCSTFSLSNQGVPGQRLCYAFVNRTPLSTGVTAQCPNGVIGDGQSSFHQPGDIGYGPGPCYGNYQVT